MNIFNIFSSFCRTRGFAIWPDFAQENLSFRVNMYLYILLYENEGKSQLKKKSR